MRYHFHIRDATGLIPDEEGGEFANLQAARDEARASARDLVASDLRSGQLVPERRIEIADDQGRVLDSVGIQISLN